jgi:hypothetical protein
MPGLEKLPSLMLPLGLSAIAGLGIGVFGGVDDSPPFTGSLIGLAAVITGIKFDPIILCQVNPLAQAIIAFKTKNQLSSPCI